MSGCCDHDPALRAGAPNGLAKLPRLTKSSLRLAVASTVTGIRAAESLTPKDAAELLGVSVQTIRNAEDGDHDLNSVALLSIGKAFGPEALNTILALIGAKAVPADAICCGNVSHIPVAIAQALPLLITLLGDNVCCDKDVRELEAAGAIDTIIKAASMLERRRNEVRLKDG